MKHAKRMEMGLKPPSFFMIWETQKKENLSNQWHLQMEFLDTGRF